MENQVDPQRRIVLIDDDRFYGDSLAEFARGEGVDIDYFESLSDLGFVGSLGRYSAAIVDYHLEGMTGVEIARYLEALFGGIPMILISSDAAAESQDLPACVLEFINKSSGFNSIVSAIKQTFA